MGKLGPTTIMTHSGFLVPEMNRLPAAGQTRQADGTARVNEGEQRREQAGHDRRPS